MFSIHRFWEAKLGVTAEAISYRPWDLVHGAPIEARLVNPSFAVERMSPGAPAASFAIPMSRLHQCVPLDVDEFGIAWFREAKSQWDDGNETIRRRKVSGAPGDHAYLDLACYESYAIALGQEVPPTLHDDWDSAGMLKPHNDMAKRCREMSTMLIQAAFDHSVLGAESDALAWLDDAERFVEETFAALKKGAGKAAGA
jgi:hypothetical protein